MANLAITYQHIADILSFESSNTELEMTLSDPKFDWDNIVVEGSKHLVLPAIYCRLKSKKILHLLPDELNSYLKEITSLNRNRNLAIIEQVHLLTALFNTHNINHVFLKGAALLAGNFYEDIAERMIGDIDILIDEAQLDQAFKLLKKNGYFPIEQTLGHDFFEHKHLPRLRTNNNICAVELHKKLFVSFQDKELKNYNVRALKQIKKSINIPKLKHLLRHNILNFQINDRGQLYHSISFRSAYDSILLLRASNFEALTSKDKLLRNYMNIVGLFFKDIKSLEPKTNFTTKFYMFKLKHIKFYKFWNRLLNIGYFLQIALGRLLYFFSNSSYRKAVLKDKKRIFRHFKSVFKNS
ncbi:MAG: nucleotidyltransferase family protein [Bacteroidota bacterium]